MHCSRIWYLFWWPSLGLNPVFNSSPGKSFEDRYLFYQMGCRDLATWQGCPSNGSRATCPIDVIAATTPKVSLMGSTDRKFPRKRSNTNRQLKNIGSGNGLVLSVSVPAYVCKLSIYLRVDSLHHNVLPTIHSIPFDDLGAVSIRKTVLPGMAIPMLKIRRPNGRLIFNMEIVIRR